MTSPMIVDDLVKAMVQLTRDLDLCDNVLMTPLGLTRARWDVLEQAARISGNPTAAQIAQKLLISRPAVQRLIKELEQKGFIELLPSGRRSEGWQVMLTESGWDIYTKASLRYSHWRAWLARDFSPQELQNASALVDRIMDRLDGVDDDRLRQGRYD